MAPRLRRVDCSAPGIRRRKVGRGFAYLDPSGGRVTDAATLDRIKGLVIPPAWTDVWICTDARGHIQATGVDARGRGQYRYHDVWRERGGPGERAPQQGLSPGPPHPPPLPPGNPPRGGGAAGPGEVRPHAGLRPGPAQAPPLRPGTPGRGGADPGAGAGLRGPAA